MKTQFDVRIIYSCFRNWTKNKHLLVLICSSVTLLVFDTPFWSNMPTTYNGFMIVVPRSRGASKPCEMHSCKQMMWKYGYEFKYKYLAQPGSWILSHHWWSVTTCCWPGLPGSPESEHGALSQHRLIITLGTASLVSRGIVCKYLETDPIPCFRSCAATSLAWMTLRYNEFWISVDISRILTISLLPVTALANNI